MRSAKEKRFEELKELIKQIRNFKKIKDLSNMLSSFEDLTRAYQKALPVIAKEEKGITPRFYVHILVEVETFLNELWEDRDGRKNLSKNNSKCLGTLRQKIRKYVKDFESDMAKFKENPDVEAEAEEEEDKSGAGSDDDDSDAQVGPAAFRKDSEVRKPASKVRAAPVSGDDSDDSDDWGSSGDDETSSSDDDNQYASLKEKFIKRAGGDDEKKKEKPAKRKVRLQVRDDDEDAQNAEAAGGEWQQVPGGASAPVKPQMFAKDADINTAVVMKKLSEILAARGKKGNNNI